MLVQVVVQMHRRQDRDGQGEGVQRAALFANLRLVGKLEGIRLRRLSLRLRRVLTLWRRTFRLLFRRCRLLIAGPDGHLRHLLAVQVETGIAGREELPLAVHADREIDGRQRRNVQGQGVDGEFSATVGRKGIRIHNTVAEEHMVQEIDGEQAVLGSEHDGGEQGGRSGGSGASGLLRKNGEREQAHDEVSR